MNGLFAFLLSKEMIIVYFVLVLASLLCVIIYFVEKNNVRLKQRHNTRELNKLVSQIKEKTAETVDSVIYEEPVLEPVVENVEPVIIEPDIKQNQSFLKEVKEEMIHQIDMEVFDDNVSPIHEEEVLNESDDDKKSSIKTLQYTTIEPSVEEAQLELKKVTEKLKTENSQKPENIKLTNYEERQEESAIISLEELVLKSKKLYEANELSQYADEGDEPISLQELEKKVEKRAASYDEPFVIENVVSIEDMVEEKEYVQVPADNLNVVDKKFKSSPIISPVYGIEEDGVNEKDIELENTANYEKLDAEIKRTTEFLMTLKELQKRLD